MKAASKAHVIVVLLAVFSMLVTVSSLGKPLPVFPFAPVSLNEAVSADSDGKVTAVVDSDSRRVLLLGENDCLDGIIDCGSLSSPIEAVTDVCVSDGHVYVAGLRYKPDSDVIATERVVSYAPDGNFEQVVYERAGTGSNVAAFRSLSNRPEGSVVAICAEASEGTSAENPADSVAADGKSAGIDISFVFVGPGNARELTSVREEGVGIQDAAYDEDGDEYATLSYRGFLNESTGGAARRFGDRVFTSLDMDADGSMYMTDDVSGALCRMDRSAAVREILPGSGYSRVHVNGRLVSVCSRTANEVKICDLNGGSPRAITSALPLGLMSTEALVVWACRLYLVALVLVLGIRKVRALVAEGQLKTLGVALASVAVVLTFAMAVGSLSYESYRSSLATRSKEIGMCADYVAASAAELSEGMERCGDRATLGGDDAAVEGFFDGLDKASGLVSRLTDSAVDNGIGMYYVLYGKDERGIFYLDDSASEHVMGTAVTSSANGEALRAAFAQEKSGGAPAVQSGRALRDATQYRLVPIPKRDGSGVAGVIEVGAKMRTFEASVLSGLAQHVLGLLVLVAAVYLAYSELRACGLCLYSFRRLRKGQSRDAVAVLTRPIGLCANILAGIDSVMTALIARSLLEQAGAGGSSMLLALPAVMLGVGLVLGQGLYALLGHRVPLRRMVASSAAATIVLAVFAGLSVSFGSFWLYCAAKLFLAVPFGLLRALGYSLPRYASTDEVRQLAAVDFKRQDTSAPALGTILGGYAAQTLGNAWVYAVVALVAVPLLLLALSYIPKGTAPLEAKVRASDEGRGLLVRFLRTPSTVALAFLVLFPMVLAAGYTSFVFPLFSADLGLAKADINNIYVLGQLVVYVCIGSICNVEARYGKRRMAGAAVALLGVVFLLFSLNATIVWAVVVIVIVAVLCKSTDGWKGMWLHSAAEAGVPAGAATGAMFGTNGIFLVVQPFVLGALLAEKDAVMVLVIGAVCFVCAVLFLLLTRRTKAFREA
ncbi:MAG: MFS transporter [Olsenella sp.]|nr:MFS transporter [Olsenella sp.]